MEAVRRAEARRLEASGEEEGEEEGSTLDSRDWKIVLNKKKYVDDVAALDFSMVLFFVE